MKQILLLILVLSAMGYVEGAGAGPAESISNVQPRRDVQGNIVDAHDGCLEFFKGTYYLYGTRYGSTGGFGKSNRYVCYSSPDLVTWTPHGEILKDAPPRTYYRPYVKFNRGTGKYVMWYNADNQYGVAVADEPAGPFTIINPNVPVKHSGRGVGDMGLFVDDDGTAYLAYTVGLGGSFGVKVEPIPHHQICVEKLTCDYLGSTQETSAFVAGNCEGPAMFKRNGIYYLLFDNTCCFGVDGSGARVYTATAPLGPFRYRGNINIKAASARDLPSPWTSPGSGRPDCIIKAQQTHVATLPTDKGMVYIWMGDRWGSRPDGIKGHDFQFWSRPLQFEEDGMIKSLTWERDLGDKDFVVRKSASPRLGIDLRDAGDELSAVQLKAESIRDPLGIDSPTPRLSWQIASTGTNVMQSAYRIIVAKTTDETERGEGDVWDSGRVESSKSLAVAYSGPTVESGHRYFWSVKVWDNQGHSSGWAKPAYWEMGLLSAMDWSGARWITGTDSPAAPLMRMRFTAAKPVAQARLYISAGGYYVASLNGHRVGDAVLDPGFTAYNKRVLYSTYDVTSSLVSGANVLGVTLGRGFYAIETVAGKILYWNGAAWISKQPFLIAKLDITYTDQTHATMVSGPDWQTRSGPTTSDSLYRGESFDARLSIPGWDTPACDARDWVNVWGVGEPDIVVNKALYGILNDPAKVRDVTTEVQRAICNARILPVDAITASGDPAPCEVKTLRVEYTIQGKPYVGSAKDFGTIAFENPPVVTNQVGIKKTTAFAPSANLQAQTVEPVRVINRLKAASMTQPKPGVYVYKFPIMMAGWPRLTVSGAAGTKVMMRCGEKLNADGTVDNMGDPGITPGEIQRFEYTLAGRGSEVWEPQFSYAGFQYIQVENFPGTPTAESLVACVVHSDVQSIGQFSCSSPLLNDVHEICKRSLLGNLHSILTDSPMYEKRGWGDDGVICAQAEDNFGMQKFDEKWIRDIADTQNARGNISDISPSGGVDYNDPSWSSAVVVLPWQLYQEYGDFRTIATHYEAIKRYVDYLSSRGKDHLVKGFFGDWVSPGVVEPPEGPDLVASANYYRDVVLFAKMALVLGRSEDIGHYRTLADQIKQAFNEKYLDYLTGVYRTERSVGYRQTSNALPLDYGMVPPDMLSLVVSNLVADVRQRGNHLNTGSFGTAALLPALSDNGQAELAYTIASQTTYPSWGWWLANGATTTWEQWIIGPQLRSRNHAFLGSVDNWFYKYLAGFRPAEPGYKKVTIRPCFPSGLSWVKSSIETPYGVVSVDWKRTGSDGLEITIGIPSNASAELWIPGESSCRVFGSGHHIIKSKENMP